MISKITGKIAKLDLRFVIIDTNGIGYKIFTTSSAIENLTHINKNDESASLWTHFAVRENSQELYGFMDYKELEFFEMLLTVSGIGPKTALAVLNTASVDTIKEGIQSGDSSYLTKVIGIGKKIAQKIVLELKDKLGSFEMSEGSVLKEGVLAIEALKSLGYSERDAREAVQGIDKNLSTQEIIREALKNLGNGK